MNHQILPIRSRNSGRNAILRYVFLPEILPRLRHLALVFRRVFFIFPQMLFVAGLLPAGHPYMNPATAHQRRIIDFFLLAWQNLSFKKENTPKIGMFLAIASAYLLTISLIIIGVLGLFFSYGQAQAQTYFSVPSDLPPYTEASDWSFQMLSRIFGPDASGTFWGGVTGQNTGNLWYTALFVGAMALYSRALAFIAAIMILYILVTSLANAARTGRPFGEQFDSVWAPIRFGIAFGLMIPLGGAYNGGQMIVFQVSEMGANMANSVWLRALREFENQQESLLKTAINDTGVRFVRDAFLINACYYGYATLLREGDINKINGQMTDPVETRPGFFSSTNMITISYGNEKAPDFCGKVELPTPVRVPEGYLTFQPLGGGASPNADNYLPNVILSHFEMAARNFLPQANGVAASSMGGDVVPRMIRNAFCERDNSFSELTCSDGQLCNNKIREWFLGNEGYWRNAYGWTPDEGFFSSDSYKEAERLFTSWIVSSLIRDSQYGWAAAGVFYIRMSAAMSSVENALNRLPRVVSMPVNISKLYATPEDQTITNQQAIDRCGGVKAGSTAICSQYKGSSELSSFLREANTWMMTAPKEDPELYSLLGGPSYDRLLQLPDGDPPVTNDTPSSVMESVFSLASIAGINVRINETSIHPLGQVMAVGKAFLNWATGIFAAAIIIGAIGAYWGITALLSLSMNLVDVAQFLVLPGFLLLVAIPMLPFLYFVTVVIEWAAAVFEAIIGMPLWILTFITARGDLTAGAMGGIKVLFEIMLRPTIIILSLLVAIVVFSASVRFFGDSMELYMGAYGANLNGEGVNIYSQGMAGIGFMVIYALGIYLLAVSCFKLIVNIPTHFGRWGNLSKGFGSETMFHKDAIFGDISTMAVMSGYGVSRITGVGATVTKNAAALERHFLETKEGYDEWRAKEIKEVDAYNMETAKYNSTIAELTEIRRDKGEEELKHREYRKPPEEVTMKDIRRAFFDKKHGVSLLEYLKQKYSRNNWNAPFSNAAYASDMAQNIPNPGQPGGGGGGGPSDAVALGILGTTAAPKASWSDRIGGDYVDFEDVKPSSNAAGKAPTKEDVLSAYSAFGLAANASAADIKRRYKQMFDTIKRGERKFKDPYAGEKLKKLLKHYNDLKYHKGFED